MRTQITELFGLNVYTDKAVYVGSVDDVVIDVDGKKIDSLAVGSLNPEIGELKGYKGLHIPFRIIKSIGDVVLIRHIAGVFKSPKKEE
ncbi:photosystem reaction center subunit H [Methanoculleus taiwanensis]|uniref:Photosystem reaction center subunit H n=1 Tax=Methanoculleus taiwanensis TaxID=1550565 RepID=A0A498H506_9EURY|nr:PRC-barrel domain-containing protein [Methanoculleus taiwanensis]RXE57098.1 photosystem reaction center subunit H [Methanoculleus taiwanensis]